jgi:hypothetical protein
MKVYVANIYNDMDGLESKIISVHTSKNEAFQASIRYLIKNNYICLLTIDESEGESEDFAERIWNEMLQGKSFDDLREEYGDPYEDGFWFCQIIETDLRN